MGTKPPASRWHRRNSRLALTAPPAAQFDKRMEKFSQQSFLPQHLEIHWFSIVNSLVLVLLLLGILATIFMRVLRRDFAKFTRDDELGEDSEEVGASLEAPVASALTMRRHYLFRSLHPI
jgi:flagellar biosynthesis/type III secretory pathway M-ring protein FliF/YscJ